MIEFVLGKTGGGKSYFALRRIVEFLVESPDGYVVTNLSINVGELNAYLKEEYPHLEPDTCRRVRILSDQEARQFYLYREIGNDIAAVSKDDEKAMRFPAFEEAANRSQPVFWVIDEAHIFFDAREWANVGATLNFFASQHRKFRSDILFITQFLDQCEKRLRQHATKFTECLNYGLRKFLVWKMPSVFRTRETYKAPPCPSDSSATYKINPKLARCYDTTAGVGVRGGRTPEKIRRKGLPFWTLIAGATALICAFWWSPDAVMKIFRLSIGGTAPANPVETKVPVGAQPLRTGAAHTVTTPGGAVVSVGSSVGPANGQGFAPGATPAPVPQLRVRGWAVRGDSRRVIVQTADGARYTEQDPEFGGISPRGNAVWIGGEKLYLVEPRIVPQTVTRAKETAKEGPSWAVSDYTDESVVPTAESKQRIDQDKGLPYGGGANRGDARSAAPGAPSPSLVQRGDNSNRPSGVSRR